MKNNKKILSEINRVNELMGNKKLLTETIIDEIIVGLTKLGTKQADEIVVALSKLTDETLTVTQKTDALDDVIRLAQKSGDDDIIKAVNSALINNSDGLISRLDDIVDNNIGAFQAGIDRGVTKDDLLGMYVDDFVPGTGDEVLDAFIKRQLRKKIGSTIDELSGVVDDVVDNSSNTTRITDDPSAPKTGDDAAKTGDEVVDDTATLTDEFPEENSMTLEDGEKVSDIFDESKWNENFTDVDATVARELMNEEWWAPFVEFFQNMVKSSEQKVITIQKIAKALETTTDASVKTALQNRLKRELVSLFKSDSKNFVKLRTYLDDAAVNSKKWKKIWNDIKSKSNGGWDFWTSIGEVAQYDSKLNNLRKVLTDGYSYVFKMWGDMSTNAIKLFQKGISKELKDSIRRNLYNVIRYGTKRGLPTIGNELYTDVITKYGLNSARAIYVRDLILNTIKINFLINFLPTTVGALSSWYIREDVKACLATKNIESEECKSLTDSRWGRFLLKRALGYRGLDELDADIDYFSTLFKNSIPFMGDNKINWDDEGWLQLTELATKDPGYIGDVVNLFFEINDLISNPTTQDQVNAFLQAEMSELETQLETVETELEQAAEEERQGSGEENQTSTEDSNTPNTLTHAESQLGSGVTQEGEYYILDGYKYKWNPSTNQYEWIEE